MPTYQDDIKAKAMLKLRELLAELPPFLAEYFRALTDQTSARTRIGYAYDLRIFFRFQSGKLDKPVADFTLDDLARLNANDISEFMEHLTYYEKAGDENKSGDAADAGNNMDGIKTAARQNDARGKSRKLAAVRTMFRFFYKRERIPANPAELIEFPKLKEKPITTLEADEAAKLLDEVDSGGQMTEHMKRFHERTKLRDAALVTLLLGTGMRVSECVGLDLTDLDFEINGARVTRKGGDTVVLYFGDEVEAALKAYLPRRETVKTLPGHERALFLSTQRRRITARAVENLVKKYASRVTALKNISPHKLRSTFGTQLYQETGDIYLVANVLGHADVNTTRKHYAKMDETQRRRAAKAVRLRET